ncbi:DUF2252 family protein [Pirellulimonas nuda]|nr:DUF2252 family protein [Pirellulimonas nuda]
MLQIGALSAMHEHRGRCGWMLAHAHTRSGGPTQLTSYPGVNDWFDGAIADFAVAYVNQSEHGHPVLAEHRGEPYGGLRVPECRGLAAR